MKIYNNYSNVEKSDYKLRLYIENLCHDLRVVPNSHVIEPTVNALNAIYKVHGNKRLKIKDSIIIVCIGKILDIDPFTLASRVDVEKKYIYNVYKLFASVPELKELLCTVSSFEYISKIYNQNDYILAKTRQLILKCQNLNVLTEHTCNTIGVVCLYYTFLDNDYSVDLCKFSDKYKVSSTTILKVYKKLSIALQE